MHLISPLFISREIPSTALNLEKVDFQGRISSDLLFTKSPVNIITSDSCVAHLAGAMGKETWLLLHFVPDWRWGIDSEQEWYPSVKNIRQIQIENWSEPINKVKKILKDKIV